MFDVNGSTHFAKKAKQEAVIANITLTQNNMLLGDMKHNQPLYLKTSNMVDSR